MASAWNPALPSLCAVVDDCQRNPLATALFRAGLPVLRGTRRYAAHLPYRTRGFHTMRTQQLGLLAFLFAPVLASAEPIDQFCATVSRNIDTLASTFQTTCLPTAGGKPGVNSVLLIADAPVFGNEKSKKAFLVVACAAVGSEMNKNSRLRLSELWFSDVERTKQRVAFVAPAAECKTLQSQVHAGSISMEQMYARLEAKTVRRAVSK
jgi:hypothetical protein